MSNESATEKAEAYTRARALIVETTQKAEIILAYLAGYAEAMERAIIIAKGEK